MARKENIRKRHFLKGQSIRQISRETKHSRQYIRKVIAEEVPTIPKYKLTKEKEKPAAGSYLDIIVGWLKEEARPKKAKAYRFNPFSSPSHEDLMNFEEKTKKCTASCRIPGNGCRIPP